MKFVTENYGESALAKRFGVKRYPAIFVNDVLVATPRDFGFGGEGEGDQNGRYAPLRSAESHTRFRADLTRVITLLLAGRTRDAQAMAAAPDSGEVSRLPAVSFTDLDGRPVSPGDLGGRTVIVEFWATWCPPCRGALTWLGQLKKTYGDRLVVLALALESNEDDVKKLSADLRLPLRFGMRTPALLKAFGDVSAVPTLLVFDPNGANVGSFYGAAPEIHGNIETLLSKVVK